MPAVAHTCIVGVEKAARPCYQKDMAMIPAIDLFAGAGGLTLGFKQAGVVTRFALEREPYRTQTFRLHSPGTEILQADVRAIDFARFKGEVEIVYGGPPCQPFSTGGLRRAERDDRDMIPAFVKAVGVIEPAAFVMENVPGLVARDRVDYLGQVVGRFQALGYTVGYKVLNAADYGVPQKRRRLFVVGLRRGPFHFPVETHGPGRSRPHVAVADVLPEQPVGELNPSRVFYAKNPDPRPSPYDGHLFNGGGRPIDPTRPCHTILASAGGNKTHFFDALGLVPDYHQHLLRGGKPRKGTLPGARRLTVTESALLQTFPEGTVFVGPRAAQYQQVGDAVPPLLAAAVARSLVRQLSGEECEVPETPTRRQQLLWA